MFTQSWKAAMCVYTELESSNVCLHRAGRQQCVFLELTFCNHIVYVYMYMCMYIVSFYICGYVQYGSVKSFRFVFIKTCIVYIPRRKDLKQTNTHHTTVCSTVRKLQWLGKISFANMSVRKAMKELQENSSRLAQQFHCSLVVALPLLIYQLQFVTHLLEKLLPRLSCNCTTVLVASQTLQYQLLTRYNIFL